MLKQESIDAIARASGVKPEELLAAIKSEEEVAIEIKQLNHFTDEELNTRVTNTVREAINGYSQRELNGVKIEGDTVADAIQSLGKRVYDDSKQAASEMFVKNYKEKNSLDFQGRSLDDLIAHIKSQKADTGELESTIEQLRKNITTKDTEIEDLKKGYEERLNATTISQKTASAIPDNLIDTIKKDHVLRLFMAEHDVKLEDGKYVVYKDGAQIKDSQLLNPLPLEQVVKTFVEDNKWLSTNKTGRGAGNDKQPPTGVEHIHDAETFFAYLTSKGIHRTSPQSIEILNKLSKDVQDKILAES